SSVFQTKCINITECYYSDHFGFPREGDPRSLLGQSQSRACKHFAGCCPPCRRAVASEGD
ncbi:hypothetical protein CH063_04601, partial [Colletotrichum higginsianum]